MQNSHRTIALHTLILNASEVRSDSRFEAKLRAFASTDTSENSIHLIILLDAANDGHPITPAMVKLQMRYDSLFPQIGQH